MFTSRPLFFSNTKSDSPRQDLEPKRSMCRYYIHSVYVVLMNANLFLKNGLSQASFSFIFRLFKQTVQFLEQIYLKIYPSSMQWLDSNPQPSEHESPLITNRPVIPPMNFNFKKANDWRSFISIAYSKIGRRAALVELIKWINLCNYVIISWLWIKLSITYPVS